MRYRFLLFMWCLPLLSYATGMAVALPNLYLQNSMSHSVSVTVANLAESTNKFKLEAHTVCKLKAPVMFLPFSEESNNFVIMLKADQQTNPIVIDRFGLLALASDSTIHAGYNGNVKHFQFLGLCGNTLQQSKFLDVVATANNDGPPLFNLANCAHMSQFVYVINDKRVSNAHFSAHFDLSNSNICH